MRNILPFILFSILLNCSKSETSENEEQNFDTNPYIGNVILTTQQEVEDFGALNHTSISGDLKIQNPQSAKKSNIKDVSKLKTLTSIGYDLLLNNNSALTDFKGLDNITEIGRDLKIQWNDNITTIDGLNSLITINRDLDIHSNQKLRNLNPLIKLKTVKGNLNIQSNGTYEFYFGIIDFCGIANLIQNNGLLGSFTIANNKGLNPTKEDIQNGNCK